MASERRRDDEDDDDVVIEHPNRKRAGSKVVRLLTVLLLLVSIFLLLVVTLGGWEYLQGGKLVQIAFIVLYVLAVVLLLRWNRGILPVVAASAIMLLIFAVVSAPGWFDRDQAGFGEPTIDADVLGLVCAILVPVQVALIIVSMLGFRQAWNVEVERRDGDRDEGDARRGRPSPAPA